MNAHTVSMLSTGVVSVSSHPLLSTYSVNKRPLENKVKILCLKELVILTLNKIHTNSGKS